MSLSAIEENPRDLHFESQEPQEKVHFLLRSHPITNAWWLILTMFLILIPPIAMAYFFDLKETLTTTLPPEYQIVILIVWYLVTLFLAFESFLLWYFNVYIITDKRVIDVDFFAIWRKRISEASLDNVEDVTYETTGFMHVLFDYGHIFMQTAAEQREFDFFNVPKPGMVHDKLTDLVHEYKQKYGRND